MVKTVNTGALYVFTSPCPVTVHWLISNTSSLVIKICSELELRFCLIHRNKTKNPFKKTKLFCYKNIQDGMRLLHQAGSGFDLRVVLCYSRKKWQWAWDSRCWRRLEPQELLSSVSTYPKSNTQLAKQLHPSETLTWNSTASWPQALHTSDAYHNSLFFLLDSFFNWSIVDLQCCEDSLLIILLTEYVSPLMGEVFSRLLKLCLEEWGICESRADPALTQLLLCASANRALI